MKAIQFQTYGGPEVLKLVDLPEPKVTSGQTLIRVQAAAVNPLDGAVRAGHFPIAAKPPLIPGEEASGTVVRDGGQFKEGERVVVYGGGLGIFANGTWAELIAVPTTSVRRLPEGLSFEQGAALPNVGVTAYGALRHGGLKSRRDTAGARCDRGRRLRGRSNRKGTWSPRHRGRFKTR